jgi:hypothetical protein
MRKKFKRILALLMILGISFVCTGCYSEDTIQELYNKIDQMEKSPNYAIIYAGGYISQTEEINFKELVKAKLKSDKKSTENSNIYFQRLEQNITRFIWKYKESNRMIGLNDNNNHYAIGTISLIDYSVSVQYFKCKYEKIDSISLSDTHFILDMYDIDNEISENNYESKMVVISRETGEKKEYSFDDNYRDSVGKLISTYKNPTTYIKNEIEYTTNTNLYYEENGKRNWIVPPRLIDIYKKSEDLTELYNILDNNGSPYGTSLAGTFITNGEELFIVFYAEHGMFGVESAMQFPVIFKCDTSLENFEYIGCVDSRQSYFSDIEIIRIK